MASVTLAPSAALATPSTAAPESESLSAETVEEQGHQLDREQAQLRELTKEVEKNNTISTVILAPIAVLVGILALGGSLGIVFSVRDQRRVSQLHELTVGGEVLSQRRAEQSYASFFEQSQTTLSLVNDTLELAKEANERATQSMERRAKEQVAAIAEKGDDLLQQVFGDGDFEKIAYKPEYRAAIHGIGDELRAVEGLLRLQDIKLPRHLKFIKAVDQFLLDDTEGALHALRQISHDGSTGELHHFILFWLGYMSTTVGDYDTAARIFVEDEMGLADDDTERFQLDCIIAETRFFDKAKRFQQEKRTETAEDRNHEVPLERLRAVASLLDDLTALAYSVAVSHDHRERHHVSLEIARTRADIFVWIAYDRTRINTPLAHDLVADVRKRGLPDLTGPAADLLRGDVEELGEEVEASIDGAREKAAEAVRFSRSPVAEDLSDDEFRAWSLIQAIAICQAQHDVNFDVDFALAECQFMAGDTKAAKDAVAQAAVSIRSELGNYVEQRRRVSLAECELICHRRLLHLTGEEQEAHQVNQSTKAALEAASKMRQERVTVFSQIQRRNISRAEFVEEVEQIASDEVGVA